MATQDEGKWKVKREISLGDLVAIAVAMGGVILAYGTLDKRISVLEAGAITSVQALADIVSRGTLLVGDHDAREILAAVDTVQAVRLYLDTPAPSIDILRTLLATEGVETVQLTQGVPR